MERLTNKREADAQRKAYETRMKQGYPRNIPEERFLRLAAYEDTGLEPEEIEQLKGEGFGLRLDKQNLEQVKQKYVEAREAICTHCMDVPCQGESCYWWQGPEEG